MDLHKRVLMLAMLSLLVPTPATAVGWGMYSEYIYGNGWTKDDGVKVDLYNHGFALGAVMDTNVAADKLLNYRLNVGYRYSTGEYDFSRNDNYDTHGFVLKNTLGFGIVRNRKMRLWAGPAIGIEIGGRYADFTNRDAIEARIGFGPEVGVNLHVGQSTSIGITAGYQYTFGSGSQTKEDYSDPSSCPEGPPTFCFDIDLDLPSYNSYKIREHILSLKLSIFFRTARDVF